MEAAVDAADHSATEQESRTGAQAGAQPARGWERTRGLFRAELRTTSAGPVRHSASTEHWLSVHAGPPVYACCKETRSLKTRGKIYLFPAGVTDDWFEDGESSAVELRLPTALVRSVASEMGLDPERASLDVQHDLRDERIEHIAWALEAECRAGSPNGRLYADSLGVALATHLLARYRAPSAVKTGLPRAKLQRVIDYIEAHLDRDLSLARLARVAGLSASHFKVTFKQSLGVPVHEYVIQRRVERAKSLLRDSDLPASQIALDAGFSHQSHMARCMRRVLGVAPSEIARARS